jgi:hypothetical protein
MKNKQRRNAEIEDMSVFEWEKQHRQQQRLISGSKAEHNYATKIEREINARAERQKTMKNTRIRDMWCGSATNIIASLIRGKRCKMALGDSKGKYMRGESAVTRRELTGK